MTEIERKTILKKVQKAIEAEDIEDLSVEEIKVGLSDPKTSTLQSPYTHTNLGILISGSSIPDKDKFKLVYYALANPIACIQLDSFGNNISTHFVEMNFEYEKHYDQDFFKVIEIALENPIALNQEGCNNTLLSTIFEHSNNSNKVFDRAYEIHENGFPQSVTDNYKLICLDYALTYGLFCCDNYYSAFSTPQEKQEKANEFMEDYLTDQAKNVENNQSYDLDM